MFFLPFFKRVFFIQFLFFSNFFMNFYIKIKIIFFIKLSIFVNYRQEGWFWNWLFDLTEFCSDFKTGVEGVLPKGVKARTPRSWAHSRPIINHALVLICDAQRPWKYFSKFQANKYRPNFAFTFSFIKKEINLFCYWKECSLKLVSTIFMFLHYLIDK